MTIALDLERKATKHIITGMANNNGYHQLGLLTSE